jgi:hypothetical protein
MDKKTLQISLLLASISGLNESCYAENNILYVQDTNNEADELDTGEEKDKDKEKEKKETDKGDTSDEAEEKSAEKESPPPKDEATVKAEALYDEIKNLGQFRADARVKNADGSEDIIVTVPGPQQKVIHIPKENVPAFDALGPIKSMNVNEDNSVLLDPVKLELIINQFNA